MRGPGSDDSLVLRRKVYCESEPPHPPLRGTFSPGEKGEEEWATVSHFDTNDTIVAVSSAPGPGFRGLVRLTGPEAWRIALAGFVADRDAPPPDRAERRTGRLAVDGLRPTLPASIALWPGPRTYTGGPLVEIHTVGSPPLLDLLLAHCLTRGARLAEPGEFTLRAFLAGRIDLTRAEAVLGVIDARSPAQLEAALEQLAGGLAGPILTLRDRLLDVLAHLEANLDFAEESDVDLLGRAALAEDLARSAVEVAALAARLRGRDKGPSIPEHAHPSNGTLLHHPPGHALSGNGAVVNHPPGHAHPIDGAQGAPGLPSLEPPRDKT